MCTRLMWITPYVAKELLSAPQTTRTPHQGDDDDGGDGDDDDDDDDDDDGDDDDDDDDCKLSTEANYFNSNNCG